MGVGPQIGRPVFLEAITYLWPEPYRIWPEVDTDENAFGEEIVTSRSIYQEGLRLHH